MSRLIDADVIYQWYRDSFDFEPNEVKFSMLDIRNNLENIPTADVPNMTGDLISRQTALSTIEANQGTLNKRRVMKILEGLPSACNENKQQATVSSDLIDRQDAIDAIHEDADWLAAQGSDWQVERMERDKSILMSLPSAEPRKKGKWIYGEKSGQDGWYCSECGGFIPWYYDFYGLDNIDFIEDFKTCPFCDSKMVSYTGADMREGE